MKYLLIGDKGQLGKEFVKELQKRNADFKSGDIDEIDVSNYGAVQDAVAGYKPDAIINCSAFNKVDDAEKYPKLANNVNALGPKYLAQAAERHHSLLVHYGTDYVYAGGKETGLYDEMDKPKPINEYGKSKLKGEENIRDKSNNYLIFRLSWVFGEGQQNFVQKFKLWASKNQFLKIAYDEVSVPTYTKCIVEATFKAVENAVTGLYCFTNKGYATRYEWAKHIVNYLKLDNILYPVQRSAFNLPASRPYFSAMSPKKISSVLDYKIPSWEEALEEYLKTIEMEAFERDSDSDVATFYL